MPREALSEKTIFKQRLEWQEKARLAKAAGENSRARDRGHHSSRTGRGSVPSRT